jgi:hypothetical protein
LLRHQIPIAILNACQSGQPVELEDDSVRDDASPPAAHTTTVADAASDVASERYVRWAASEASLGSRLVEAGVQLVLAMGYSVTVSAAERLMRTLYQQLFAGEVLPVAIQRARRELATYKERRAHYDQHISLEDWLLPMLFEHQTVRLNVRQFAPNEAQAFYKRQAELEEIANAYAPTYGFVGRDLDILALERRLLTKRNCLLVRGMGGAGKTTLLRHVGWWWRATGLVEQVCYFGYDERAWTAEQIVNRIAEQVMAKDEYTQAFLPMSFTAKQAQLASRLRSERHLLLLGNLESITGSELAIQHTLPATEQQALHQLVQALAGGQTLVLLGSRGGEAWLAPGTFADNVYDLPGLDPEAASLLAERILERAMPDADKRATYRRDPALRELLQLLDGFPLALEVVLANLAQRTPAEVLDALRQGNVTTMRVAVPPD